MFFLCVVCIFGQHMSSCLFWFMHGFVSCNAGSPGSLIEPGYNTWLFRWPLAVLSQTDAHLYSGGGRAGGGVKGGVWNTTLGEGFGARSLVHLVCVLVSRFQLS
jgi:hypothetical protein